MSGKSNKLPPAKELLAWLVKQASKLRRLVTCGWKIQADYLQNAKEKGEILAEVHRRLDGSTLTFEKWVKDNTEIGLSTAYLWMDVAEWWDDVKAHIDKPRDGVVSHPLETSLRGIRDTIRSIRQARGLGKPGSGKKSVTEDISSNSTTAPPSAGVGEDDADNKDDDSGTDNGVPGDGREDGSDKVAAENFKMLMARKQPGGGMTQGETRTPARPRLYKVTVVTPNKADLQRFAGLLPSPTTDFMAHSVSAHIGLQDIDKTLAAVGTCLNTAQPKKVRVVVEL